MKIGNFGLFSKYLAVKIPFVPTFIRTNPIYVAKLIIGDNYQALQNLLIQYRDKIDVIYIDPPYGKDSMGEFAKTNYNNAITGDNLLSMLYPRLVLARQLLSDGGVIFCSIDDKNQAYVKCLFDEIFGEENFITCFTRKTKSSSGDDGNGTNIQHDYLLVYGKYKNNVFLLGDEKSFENYKNPDNDPNGEWCSGNPSAKSGGDSTYFPIKNPYKQKVDYPPEGRFWAFSKNTMNEYIKEGRITFKKEYSENQRGFVFKRYKNKMESIHSSLDSLFAINNIYMNQSATNEMSLIFNDRVFDYPKPMCFVKKLIQFSTKNDSSVLDFFAGSGTTGLSFSAS
ncbi:site-specific DNA-methyltransferase [uncultured Treponema sp.]|uniref:site-specific DNA-methyltransferase n=1 Tax=uncultured Treponema sp. TaxID=162155 RepID=UPI00258537C4|nr:site-specific DNA-methyltransferase [uncultured Treponema sp.]